MKDTLNELRSLLKTAGYEVSFASDEIEEALGDGSEDEADMAALDGADSEILGDLKAELDELADSMDSVCMSIARLYPRRGEHPGGKE